MKKIQFIALVALMATSLTVSAQSTSTSVDKGWSTFWFQWSPSKTKSDITDFNKISFTGLSLGYSRAFSVSPTIPLYAEAGIGAQYSFNKDTDHYEDDGIFYVTKKHNALSARVPVNLMYKWDIPYSKFALMPYFGVNFRFNILAKENRERTDVVNGVILSTENRKADCFDDDDMEKTWSRFQAGWELGFKVAYNNTYQIGIAWGKDFNDFAHNTKAKYTNITLGYMF